MYMYKSIVKKTYTKSGFGWLHGLGFYVFRVLLAEWIVITDTISKNKVPEMSLKDF